VSSYAHAACHVERTMTMVAFKGARDRLSSPQNTQASAREDLWKSE
jgi:hypothetical protein